MDVELLELRRLTIGEAGRFPQLGRAFYERGVGRTADALCEPTTTGVLLVHYEPA